MSALLFALLLAAFGDDVGAKIREFEKYYGDRNEHVRKAAVYDLSLLDDPAAVDPMLKALGDSSEIVKEEATRGLARFRSEEALDLLVRRLEKDRPAPETAGAILESFKTTRPGSAYDAVLALAEKGPFETKVVATELIGVYPSREGRSEALLEKLASDRETLVRLAAIDSMGKIGAATLSSVALERLERDPEWRVRAAAIETLRRLRTKDAVAPLIAALEREDGRLRDDCQAALVDLSGDAVAADTPEKWREWWNRVGDTFTVPSLEEVAARKKKQADAMKVYAPPSRKGYAPFVGIETRSKRILFVIDVSTSMSERLVLSSKDPARLAAFRERFGDYDTKIELAREELIETVAALEPHVRFNIATLHSVVDPWKDDLVPATAGSKSAAIKFLADLTPEKITAIGTSARDTGRTSTFDALNFAFGLTKTPSPRPSKSHKVESDTVFFLSDGMPTAGRIQDPGEIVRYFRTINARARIVFHTITFGHGNESLMRPIAELSGGQYLVISLD